MNHPEAEQYEDAAPALERAAAAAVATEAVALTHSCKPREGFRCWQFNKAWKALPRWISEWLLVQSDGSIEFQYPGDGETYRLKDGDWIVAFDVDSEAFGVYSAEEFKTAFECVKP